MLRLVVFSLTAFLVVVGVGMCLSLTAGGVMFGLGCFVAALSLWLLYRGVMALELQAELLVQSLLQGNKVESRVKDDLETPICDPEAVVEEARPARPVAAGD